MAGEQYLGRAQQIGPEANTPALSEALNQLTRGRSNAVGLTFLEDGETETVVAAPNCGQGNAVFLFPADADSAALLAAGDVWVAPADVQQGSFTIQHSDPGNETTSFFFLCLG